METGAAVPVDAFLVPAGIEIVEQDVDGEKTREQAGEMSAALLKLEEPPAP